MDNGLVLPLCMYVLLPTHKKKNKKLTFVCSLLVYVNYEGKEKRSSCDCSSIHAQYDAPLILSRYRQWPNNIIKAEY